MINLGDTALDARVDRLEGVRGLQGRAQFTKDAQTMERQGLFEAFVQT